MPLFERSFNNILGDSLLELNQNTNITRVSPGSKARAILEVVSREINGAYKSFDVNFARAFLSGADGQFLDLLGEVLGIGRLGTEAARASASAKVVKFFVETGTFGDINDGNPIVLPAGTLLSTQPESAGVLYKLLTGVVLSAGGNEQFISVVALSTGNSSNLGTEALKFHNFTSYTDSVNNTLKVTNTSGIFSGSNPESDANYRFRISRSAIASEAANATSVLLAALTTPGVANVIIQDRATGIGTYRVLIKAVTPTVSAALLDAVNAALSLITAEGIKGMAAKPDETGLEFVLTLRYKNGLSIEEKDQIDAQVRLAVEAYVNDLDIGEEFILNEIVDRVLSVSPSIKDMGQPNKPIDDMFVHRESRLRDNKVRQELLNNYVPTDHERVIIEPSLTTPITILRAN